MQEQPGMVHSLIPEEEDLCVFKASLVYIVYSRSAREKWRDPLCAPTPSTVKELELETEKPLSKSEGAKMERIPHPYPAQNRRNQTRKTGCINPCAAIERAAFQVLGLS